MEEEDNNRRRMMERERYERYQIEQILQLDLEELQVEEVDVFHDSSDDDNNNNNHANPIPGYGTAGVVPGEFTYNTCIASLHTYLGDVEDTHHRSTFLDGGTVLTLPIFCLQGICVILHGFEYGALVSWI